MATVHTRFARALYSGANVDITDQQEQLPSKTRSPNANRRHWFLTLVLSLTIDEASVKEHSRSTNSKHCVHSCEIYLSF